MYKPEMTLVIENCRDCFCVGPNGKCNLIKKINFEFGKDFEENVSHHYNQRTYPDICPLLDKRVMLSGKMEKLS